MNYKQYSDPDLLELVSRSDQQAFNEIFRRYRDRLFSYLMKFTKSPEISEEIVVDIFMKLWEGRAIISKDMELSAFLHKVGYYKVIDFLRAVSRQQKLRDAYITMFENPVEKAPDELIMNTQLKSVLMHAINQLPAQRKKIYLLSREEGLSHEQIARILHLSPSTVNNTINAANRSIARLLQKELQVIH